MICLIGSECFKTDEPETIHSEFISFEIEVFTPPSTQRTNWLRKDKLFIGSILLSILIFIPFVTAKVFAVPPFSISGITSLILSLSILNDTSRQVLAYFETRKFLLLSD